MPFSQLDNNNGLTASMFDLSSPALVPQGAALATGYLCVGCHGSASNEHVFAVNVRGATPAIHYTANAYRDPAIHAAAGNVTGHQVWVQASSAWYNPGAWYSGGGAHDYYLATYVYVINGVKRAFKVTRDTTFNEVTPGTETVIGGPYTAAQIDAMGPRTSEIAYNNAFGCGACHDALRADGKLAFPHGYVTTAGAPAPKRSTLSATVSVPGFSTPAAGQTIDSSYLWMTVADDADGAKTLMLDNGNANISSNRDGACLKCHLSGDKSAGVGATTSLGISRSTRDSDLKRATVAL